jgi:hypothetical protein
MITSKGSSGLKADYPLKTAAGTSQQMPYYQSQVHVPQV